MKTLDNAVRTATDRVRAGYEVLALIRSETRGREDTFYTLSRRTDTGELSCNCGAWIFRAATTTSKVIDGVEQRLCKHLQKFVRDGGITTTRQRTLLGAVRAAADVTQLRALLYERQWDELAAALAKCLADDLSNAVQTEPDPVYIPGQRRPVRMMKLED